MKISLKDSKTTSFASDALILPLALKQQPPRELGPALAKLIRQAALSGEFTGKAREVHMIHTGGLIKAGRLVLAGLGKKPDAESARKAGGAAVSAMRGLKSAALYTGTLDGHACSTADIVEGALLSAYDFTRYKRPSKKPPATLTVLARQSKKLGSSIKYASAVAGATNFARDLVNTPAREMTPSALARAAKGIRGLSIRTLGRNEAKKLGMNAYLSVAGGSKEPPVFIIAKYNGADAGVRPTVLVGKSVTFDSGGLSLKPAGSMETMKYDMAGGAAVLGAMRAAYELKLKANLIALLPASENLPGGDSPNMPGDVVRAMDGTGIEILNTDAEGRLLLADAIAYAAMKLKPARIIDLATLTGACSIALGNEACALMGNNEKLIKALSEAGDETYERAWPMPLYEEYDDYIKSDIADIKNIGRGRSGGLVTAACFLKGFAGKTPWAHLDIAGTAWADKPGPYTQKGATGMGVRLLIRYLSGLR